jgi:cell division protein FtsI (penicillin-binding protein 3)
VRFARTLTLPANRGRVLDRNGMLLASSVPAPSIWANPEDMERDPAKLRELARLLDMSPLSWIKNSRTTKRPLSGCAGSSMSRWSKKSLRLGIKGVYDIKEYKRLYPEGEAAAHIVGFTNVEDQGQEGVELVFQNSCPASPARAVSSRTVWAVWSKTWVRPCRPVDGEDLQLSIDSKVQFFAYQKLREAVLEHKAKAGSVVVLDAQSGEILALANYPSYSPDKRVNLSGEQLRNRALTDTFEPGSTMKPFAVALALEKGLVKPETPIQTAPGRITITGSTITDAHPHGVLTVNEVIQKSSNVGTVKMAMQLQPREMWEMFAQVGFGQKPQLPFPGVVSGRLRPYKTWRPIEQATMSYGYGISGSLFQVARAYTVFARDGEVVPATLMKAEQQVQGVRVFSAENAKSMRKMLQMAAGPGGTAQKAQTMGYSVGGKTGTAHKQEGKGYAG